MNSDACAICGDGGELLCCDSCPYVYHLWCIGLETVPKSNNWQCEYCLNDPQVKSSSAYHSPDTSSSDIFKTVAKLSSHFDIDIIDGFEFKAFSRPDELSERDSHSVTRKKRTSQTSQKAYMSLTSQYNLSSPLKKRKKYKKRH